MPVASAPPPLRPEKASETLSAAIGVVDLLLATDLTLEQKHYALTLVRLLTGAETPEAPPTKPQATAYIDPQVLAELYHYLPPGGCAAIVEQFRSTAQQLMGAIAEALAAEASETLARTAHSLIGTVGAVGMTQMAQEARAIVEALQRGDWPCAAERATALPALYRASAEALETVLENLNKKTT